MRFGDRIRQVLPILFFITFCATRAAAQPNLTPYQPSGWSDKIVIARTTGTTIDSTGLTTADTLYVNWAVINDGTAATAATFYTYLYVDGVYQTDWTTPPPLNTNTYTYINNYSLGSLSAGTHTIEIYADATGVIPESNENDNSYTKTITVSNPSQPNLTPYQPAGWSDKIVVARTTGTTIDSTGLTTADSLYVDWAVINDGTAATAATFYTYLYVDGVYQMDWTTPPPMDANSYTFVTNYSLGSLGAGTHTIEIYADATGVIPESNENDNSYTKTITVSNPSQPNLTPYQPSGWSDKIVIARTTGATIDSTGLTTADTLYVNWAVINDGTAATAATFYTYLYVDGVYQTDWTTPPPLNTNTYTYINNYSLGSLSAGTHTIEIYADATGVIPESNENDNSYTKTITVSAANLPAPVLSAPANGSTGQSVVPSFTWSTVPGALSYRLLLAISAADLPSDPTATNGGPSVVTNVITTAADFTPSNPLVPGTTYYWEVHARNASQYGTWSSVNSFTTSPLSNGLTIIPIFDSSITSDPQAATIEATINSAIAVYENTFSTPITVSIKFEEMGSGLGQSSWMYSTISYSDYLAALTSHATASDDATALAHLSGGPDNPVNGNQNMDIKYPLARALGFSANPPSGQPDGTIGLYTGIMNLSANQTDPAKYSLFSTVSHEIDEVLGMGSALDLVKNGSDTLSGPIFSEDLFRYDQNGARNYTTNINATSYFSIDGIVDLAQFNQVASGDYGDWYSYYGGQIPEVQDAYQTPGATPVLGVEIRVLDVIGYNRLVQSTPPIIQTVQRNSGTIIFTWTAVSGQHFQVQTTQNISQPAWVNVGSTINANGATASFTNSINSGSGQFFRVELLSTASPSLVRSQSQVPLGPIGVGTNYLRPSQL